jgi:hypothetical protein
VLEHFAEERILAQYRKMYRKIGLLGPEDDKPVL